MKKIIVYLAIVFALSGCSGPTQQEIGQTVLTAVPFVFLISIAFQYLFFRLWKRKWPEITMNWMPNLIFLIFLIISALSAKFFIDIDNSLTSGVFPLSLSYLPVLFIFTRIWLFLDHTKAFTWASIVAMFLFISPAFPMAAEVGKDSPLFWQYTIWVWMMPATIPEDLPGAIALIVFLVLIIEAWFSTRKKTEKNVS
jgi:hypothetical protein